ncbi:hypothetical protein B0I37DRAFT_191526 [Chaetomium sp. MPI-CAGE-AT-0009]|nr:hypothetical protein B0I37DRAFT_191526 [Chaetomium sp. MPI-CAGE-AT-0009]
MEESKSSNAAIPTSQIPSIDDQLVTPDNPPRTDLDGMDHVRCAALHNYLVDYCLAADGLLDPAAEGSRATYFSTHGDAAEAISPRLHPSVAAFLAAARTPDAPLFFFVGGMPNPDGDLNGLFDNETADNEDEPEDSIVRLYFSHMDACGGKSGGGMLYHQGRHLASFFVHPDDTGFAFPVDEHPQNWHPLETILSNWIALIRLGKVVASPTDDPAPYGGIYGLKIGNWEWRPYGDGQVAGCVAAWDRLCDAIEVRRRQSSRGAAVDHDNLNPPSDEPLLTPAAMNAAQIPDPSFARAFLGLARRPRHIRQIAPGLSLPPADAAAFAAAQPFTHLPRRVPQWDGTAREGIIPPVYLFFSHAGAPQVDISNWRSSFRYYWNDGHRNIPAGIPFPSRVPPGVYSECLVRSDPEATEEGFRLLLPFRLYGARLSSGDEIQDRAADELFQHGFKPFGGDPHRPQRLERLLDHWADLVERGVWSVGPHGVQGSIEVFKDATVNWADYTIPSSW